MKNPYICSHCGYTFEAEEMVSFSGRILCAQCFNELTVVCECCGRTIWADDAAESDIVLCQPCFDDNFTVCECCGHTIHCDSACYFDDDNDYPYCSSCYDKREASEYIHEYNYKPDPIFYGTDARYFGVELEIDSGGQFDSTAIALTDIANTEQKHIYIKNDGSLNEGMEIVTHPMTLEYHISQMPWLDIMNKAIVLGYRSHKTSTCGLHIHVNRISLGDTAEEQERCISRILFFVERFWQELLKFSRRTESQINRWAARYGIKDDPKATLDNAKKKSSNRYTCVNLSNSNTIEFRIFRGTLKYNTLIAALQLVNRICDMAVNMTDDEITALNWCDFAARITEPELITYLKERRLYVNEPIESEEDV